MSAATRNVKRATASPAKHVGGNAVEVKKPLSELKKNVVGVKKTLSELKKRCRS
jgi:hypothetical protein